MNAEEHISSSIDPVKGAYAHQANLPLKKRQRAGRPTGPGAYQQASKNARFGHTRWLVWDQGGTAVADRCNPKNLKECLLAEGTNGQWILIHDDGCGMVGTWPIGINVLNQMRRGL